MSHIQTVQGKIVCKIWLLDNSYKTVLVEPTSTVQVSMVDSGEHDTLKLWPHCTGCLPNDG